MLCVKCGTALGEGEKFCTHCGAPAPFNQQQPQPDSAAPLAAEQQPAQANPASPAAWQQPQQGFTPPESGKPPKKFPLIPVIAGAVVVVLALVAALNLSAISGFYLRTFAAPDKYYRQVEARAVAGFSASASAVYDNLLLSNADYSSQSVDGSASLEIGDGARELLAGLAGPMLDQLNPGDDFSWLKSLELSLESNNQDKLADAKLAILLNGTRLLSMDMVSDLEQGTAAIAIPELAPGYFRADLEEMQSALPRGSVLSMMPGASPEGLEQLTALLQALPDDDQVETLLTKYLDHALSFVKTVEKEKATLTVDGVSAGYTALTAHIDGETAAAAVRSICEMMRGDSELRDIIVTVAGAGGQDGQQAYGGFLEKLDETIRDADKIREKMDGELEIVIYVDSRGNIHGRELRYQDFTYTRLMPEKGDSFGLKLAVENQGKRYSLEGSGKRGGDALTGELELIADGAYYGAVKLEGFDTEKLKTGFLSGTLIFTPSEAVWSRMELPATVGSALRDFSLRFELDTGRDQGTVKITMTGADAKELLSLTIRANRGASRGVTPVSGAVEPEEWAQGFTQDALMSVIRSLETAGVPQVYTSMLSMLGMYLG